jgi:HEAT repeat protein
MLNLLETRESPLRTWIVEKAENHRLLGKLHLRSAIECQLEGLAGFEVLGTNCAAAVGELTTLLDDKELGFLAVRCLDSIGKPAEQPLCRCLTNGDVQVRSWSVWALASVTDDVEVYMSRIKPLLNDADAAVRFATVQAVAAQSDAPDLAVPLLISSLRDSADSVCEQAAHGLVEFGANALSAVPTLTNLVSTGREAQGRAALNALAVIAPGEALPVLTNAVVNGSPSIMGTALRALKPIAPELALKMTLAEFHSNNPQRWRVVLGVAKTYEVETPGIAEAIKFAAKSSDPETARRAVATMLEMVREREEQRHGVILLPGEPSYEGRPLGEWLGMRRDGYDLSTNAVEVLRGMGTNVIPALLARLVYTEPIFGLDDYDVSMGATVALIAMGERARPALPGLSALMDGDNSNLVLRAMMATLGTGTNAMPCLVKGLTNQFPDVRGEAAHFVVEWGAQFPEARRQALPYVTRLLNDPDEQVRKNAVEDLKEMNAPAAGGAAAK